MLQLMPRSKCDGAEKNGAADISCRRWGERVSRGGDGEEVVVVTKAGTGVDEGDVLEESLKGTRRQKMGLCLSVHIPTFLLFLPTHPFLTHYSTSLTAFHPSHSSTVTRRRLPGYNIMVTALSPA